MEIKVNVNVEMGDRTFELFKELLGVLGGVKKTSTAKDTPVKTAPAVKEQVTSTVEVPTTAVPTAPAHTYTMQELGNAAKPIIDAGRSKEISALLQNKFGVKSLKELAPEKYGEFATAIRAMGANI